jgi:hypothetical protein
MNQAIKWGLSVIVIALFVTLMMGSSESTESTEKSKKDSGEAKQTFKIGDNVKVEDFIYRVEGVEEKSRIESGNQFIDDVTTTGKFVIVDVTVTNNDKESRYVDSNMFKLLDSGGTEFSASNDANTLINSDMGFFLEEINPKLNRRGKIAFEVPKDAVNLSLQVSSGLGWSGGEYESISLQAK